jgi:prolyl oligopeptidase
VVLLTTTHRDPRVQPSQVAKMTAQLRKATAASKNPAPLKVPFDTGHRLGSTRTQVDEQRADEYASVLWRTGTRGFRAAGPDAAPCPEHRIPRGIGRNHYDQEPTHCL